MKPRPGPYPLIVAVTGSAAAQAKTATRLAGGLLRRGLRVRVLRTPREKLFLDSDIALVLCQVDQIEPLAKRLEQAWTENWLTRYATRRQSSGAGR